MDQPKPILFCPFCDAKFNIKTIWRAHAHNHWIKKTANQSTQTCDFEFLTKSDLVDLKIEMANEFDTMNIDNFINLSSNPSEVKLEPRKEEVSHIKNIVPNNKQRPIKRKCSKKPAVKPKFTFPTEPINCAICNKIIINLFSTAEETTEEFERTKQVECRLCGLSIEQLDAVPIHYNRTHVDKDGKLTKAACNACVANKSKGKQLQFENVDPTWIKCELCLKLNPNQTSYQNHLRHFHKDRCVYTCAQCDRQFIGRSRYTKHVYTTHSQKFKPRQYDKEYHCDHCGKKFRMRSGIIAHLHAHFAQQRLQCTLCPVTLKSVSNLTRHMLLHSGLKDVTCHVCGKQFAEASTLRSHMPAHSDEKPFPCPECGKRFSRRTNMLKHSKTHTGMKPHACDQCDKRYCDRTDLRRHIRSHGGMEKTQICTLCDKRYYEPKYLRAHMKSAHSIVVATTKS